MHPRVSELIRTLELSPHPEGGHFREIHRSSSAVQPDDGRGRRDSLTVIYFLLAAGDISRWHRVASDEAWHFVEGEPLRLHTASPDFEQTTARTLGPFDTEAQPALVVEANHWQAAEPLGAYGLVACDVGPGFDFEDFAMLRDLEPEAERHEERHSDARFLI